MCESVIHNTDGVMRFDGTQYHYNLSTSFNQLNIKVMYPSAPTVVVGTDVIQLEVK